jgi:aminotransferase
VPVTFATRAEEDFQVNPTDVEARITPRTKAILIGYPNNPTGAVMPREKLMAIAALAEKYDLLVISDEIYDRLVYDGRTRVSRRCRGPGSEPSSSAASPRITP